MKIKWVLDGNNDIVETYNARPIGKASSVKRSIEQIYGYEPLNKLLYGVLSAYDTTWFVKVSDVEKHPGGKRENREGLPKTPRSKSKNRIG